MTQMLRAKSAEEFIHAGKAIVQDLLAEDALQFTHDVTDRWRAMDTAWSLEQMVRLRSMMSVSSGVCKRLLASLATLTPHSMATERVVSHYNNSRSPHRLPMAAIPPTPVHHSAEWRWCRSLRPPASRECLLARKEGRMRETYATTYKDREVVSQFFRDTGGVL